MRVLNITDAADLPADGGDVFDEVSFEEVERLEALIVGVAELGELGGVFSGEDDPIGVGSLRALIHPIWV